LEKWCSKNEQITTQAKPENRTTPSLLHLSDTAILKMIGLLWNRVKDVSQYSLNVFSSIIQGPDFDDLKISEK
jgi:hypothetical protein